MERNEISRRTFFDFDLASLSIRAEASFIPHTHTHTTVHTHTSGTHARTHTHTKRLIHRRRRDDAIHFLRYLSTFFILFLQIHQQQQREAAGERKEEKKENDNTKGCKSASTICTPTSSTPTERHRNVL